MAKSKVSRGCLDAASEALAAFTDSELSQYVTDVFNRAEELNDLDPTAAIEQAQNEINNETLKSLYNDTKTKFDDIEKVTNNVSKIESNELNLREMFARRAKGYASNLTTYMRSAKQILEQVCFRPMEQEDFDYLRNKNAHDAITKELDGQSTTPEAKRISALINDYLAKRSDMMVNSGALPLEFINDDRFFRAIHNVSKIMSGGKNLLDSAKSFFRYNAEESKGIWKSAIKPLLDLEGTFKNTDAMGLDGALNDAEVDKILDDIYENIVHSKSDVFSRSEVVNDQETIIKRRRMFFKWKNWDSFNKYNEQYGTGDLYSAWQSDIHGTANKVGTANLLGSNADKAYNDLRKAQFKATPDKGPLWFSNTDLYYKVARGIDQAPVSPTLANFFGNIRALSSMSALPLIALKSTTDSAYVASFAAQWGLNYWKSFGGILAHQFDILKSDDRQYIAKLFKGMIHAEHGNIGRFIDSHNTSEMMQKANTTFYRYIGLSALDTGNKVGILHLMAMHLGEMSKVSYEGLNDTLKSQFAKYDLKPHEWNLLRQKTERGLFTTDNVEKLTDSDIAKLHEQSDKSISLRNYRTNLFAKVYAIFDVASENAVLTPGVFEKAWLYQGTPPGTIRGELMRCFAQFKAYPLAYIDRVLVNGFKNAIGSQAKVAWALQMTLATLPLSVANSYLSYAASGLSFPDVSEMSPSELTKFGLGLIQPNLGTYMTITNQHNQDKSLLESVIRSNSLNLLSDGLSIPLALATGHPDAAKKAFKDASSHILPTKTFPGLSPYMMGMLGEKPYMESHQHIIYGYGR